MTLIQQLAVTVAIAALQNPAPQSDLQKSLSEPAGRSLSNCVPLPENTIAADPRLQRVAKVLDIGLDHVEFDACRSSGFFTDTVVEPGFYEATIRLPLPDPAKWRDIPIEPLAHELGHILQVKQAGSYDHLVSVLTRREIELGADYLAGYSLHKATPELGPTYFSGSRELLGSYIPLPDDHGTPIERTNAFRLGWFEKEKAAESPTQAHLLFQYNLRTKPGLFGD